MDEIGKLFKELLKDAVREVLREQPAPIPATVEESSQEKPITTKQLCEFLNITEPTVIRWKQKGKIPFIQIGSAVRFDLKKVLKALEE